MLNFLRQLAAAWKAGVEDNIGLLAAGVSYYAFLAFVPTLAASVLFYGLIVDAETVTRHVTSLANMLPDEAAVLVGEQLTAIVATSAGKKGLGLVLALGLALIGARNGAASVVTAVTLAYNREERRKLVRGNLVALAITACAVLGVGLVIIVLTVTAALQALLPQMGDANALLGKLLSYGILLAAGIGGAAMIYIKAPYQFSPRWREVTPGAILCGFGWGLCTFLFGIYVANFGNYNATYGTLGAVVVLLTWLYLAAYILLFGAELASVRISSDRNKS